MAHIPTQSTLDYYQQRRQKISDRLTLVLVQLCRHPPSHSTSRLETLREQRDTLQRQHRLLQRMCTSIQQQLDGRAPQERLEDLRMELF